jgi:anti-anti-sigma factor
VPNTENEERHMTQRNAKPFEIEIDPLEGDPRAALVTAKGFLDAQTATEFERRMGVLMDTGTFRVIMETSLLAFVSSAGVGAIMRFAKRLEQNDGGLAFLRPPPKILAVFDLLGLSRVLCIAETVEEAATLLRDGA